MIRSGIIIRRLKYSLFSKYSGRSRSMAFKCEIWDGGCGKSSSGWFLRSHLSVGFRFFMVGVILFACSSLLPSILSFRDAVRD